MERTTEDHPGRITAVERSKHEEKKQHRRQRKKPGSLPLGMFLSIEGVNLNPECILASNPFHKCGKHCFQKITGSGSKSWPRSDRSDGGKGSEKIMLEKRNVHPECIYASNPYHICVEACFRKMNQNDKVKGGVLTISEKDRAERAVVATKETKGDAHTEAKGNVHAMCIYASNPYHTCVNSCFQRIGQKDIFKGVVTANERKEDVKRGGMVDVQPKCRYASNPFHNCTESCGQGKPGKDGVKKAVVKVKREEVKKVEKRNIGSKCVDASNADDECSEYFSFTIQETNLIASDKSERRSEEGMEITKREDEQIQCVNTSNIQYALDEYCSGGISEMVMTEECKPQSLPSSPIDHTDSFTYLLVYVAHLIAIEILYRRKNMEHV